MHKPNFLTLHHLKPKSRWQFNKITGTKILKIIKIFFIFKTHHSHSIKKVQIRLSCCRELIISSVDNALKGLKCLIEQYFIKSDIFYRDMQ